MLRYRIRTSIWTHILRGCLEATLHEGWSKGRGITLSPRSRKAEGGGCKGFHLALGLGCIGSMSCSSQGPGRLVVWGDCHLSWEGALADQGAAVYAHAQLGPMTT